jgi:peptidoglycan/xylan/chitin deacetylase (PgdA/CDA1 family)
MRNLKLGIYFICRLLGLFRAVNWLTRDRLRILCYHGIALLDEAQFRPRLFITLEQFERRLRTIRNYGFKVTTLTDAIERLYSGNLPNNSAVITVDDGFHSFHRLAVPCLERAAMPATVYVTSYYVQKGTPVFRLVVQYMFWKTRKRALSLNGVAWTSARVVDLADAAAADRAMWECIDFGERHCTEPQRCEICREVGVLLETPYDDIVSSRTLHLMTPEELSSLPACHIDVALHTHRHNFPADDRMKAAHEISENRDELGRWVTNVVPHFCYPSGQWHQHQWAWLDAMEIESSATCVPGLNSARTPRHALRRLLDAESIHQLEFEAALSGFADLWRGLRSSVQRLTLRPATERGSTGKLVH